MISVVGVLCAPWGRMVVSELRARAGVGVAYRVCLWEIGSFYQGILMNGSVATTWQELNRGVWIEGRLELKAASPKAVDTKRTWLLMSPLVVPLTCPL